MRHGLGIVKVTLELRKAASAVSVAPLSPGYGIVNQRLLLCAMTKNLGNAARTIPRQQQKNSPFGRLAPALFPLVVVALGYMIGRQFFGF
ncbi:hypothetical protein FJV76_02715 [Mesorhizobium sp. WSM4303]|uniref:hypothetical protein n=1 Tax=unclassified Mesorhizobium TaxID=325217 RepID=UPI00115C7C88|nr:MULTISPECIES: hypothetical protein [unclassified Mesorhizobium]TRC96785.1 hypothetical protein FJV77_12380 [Mesorhizobium sp. WSM4306]TRD08460.1 hypothetical protein FJV76_02715 [Mesorhizobium sp. WSM4303]